MARDAETPTPLFRTAITELGRWLTYELLRDWLPHRPVSVHTPLGDSDGHVIDASVELAVVPILRAGLGLWEGGQAVLPTARVWHVGLRRDEQTSQPHWYLDGLPDVIGERTGVLVYDPMIATGGQPAGGAGTAEAKGCGRAAPARDLGSRRGPPGSGGLVRPCRICIFTPPASTSS